MSEFKFACPVCGQHITCDSRSSGTQMECPTCYRKIVVPQAPSAQSPSLILTAAQVSTRPPATAGGTELLTRPSKQGFPFAAVALLLVVCAAAAGAYAYRDRIFRPGLNHAQQTEKSSKEKRPKLVRAPYVPPANDTNWTLNLAAMNIPESPAAGRINGLEFALQRATLQGGTLSLRQGPKWPPDVGLTILLFARQGEDLAGKSVNIEATRTNAPKVILRWKDEEERAVTSDIRQGYALRLEFGPVTGKMISGKLYLCTPDDAKSFVAGAFDAEIRKPPPPKPPVPPKPKP